MHIGCGPSRKAQTTRGFNQDGWDEIRFDIDPSVEPDIVGTMTDMSGVADASVDAIFSSHNIEHLYPHEVPGALQEFRRVLRPNGFLILTCPDLQSVCALIAEGNLLGTAYESPAGPISPIDILYGHRQALAKGNLYMAHRSGFTEPVLAEVVQHCGFPRTASTRRGYPSFDLWLVATAFPATDADITTLASQHFPN
ncbi:MAG TPA: class I SAM-dependent methyltransferase [Burkholderiaceae bacterium]